MTQPLNIDNGLSILISLYFLAEYWIIAEGQNYNYLLDAEIMVDETASSMMLNAVVKIKIV